MAIELRAPMPGDAEVICDIIFRAFKGISDQHNFPPDFIAPEMTAGFGRMLMAPASGFFGVVAEESGKIVGSNFLDERDAIKGVGPITIEPNCQSRGIGRKLMEAVIHRGKSQNAAGIRLVQDAFNTVSMSLYASLGFDIKEPLALMGGVPKSTGSKVSGTVRTMREEDLHQCATLCRKVHGFDRTGELRGTIAGKVFRPYVLERHGRVVAYASGPEFFALNHGVAEAETDLRDLLCGACAANDGKPLNMLVPTRRADFFRWCLSQGLRVIKPMSLMAMGDYREPAGAFYPSVQY